MKKMVSRFFVVITIAALLTACGAAGPKQEEAAIRLASLKGPTTMGLVKLLDDSEAGTASCEIQSEIYGTADEISALLINGTVDIAAIPANLAAILYARTDGAIQVAAINTLGVLYVVENGDTVHSVADLKGKTIYSIGKGTTPEWALNSLLQWNGIDPAKDMTIEYRSEATELAALLNQTGEGIIAVLPQPYVASVIAQNDTVRVALDITQEWQASSGKTLVTGVVAVRKEFAERYPDTVAAFLAGYRASVDWVNANLSEAADLIEKYGIVAKAAIAKQALPGCNIVFIEGADMKTALSEYLEVLYAQNPQSVGGSLPDEGFYYKA